MDIGSLLGGGGGGSKEFGSSTATTTFSGNDNYGGGDAVIWVALAVIGLAAALAFAAIIKLASK